MATGLGYTDVSEVKDRGYFDSIYVRTPSGAMFEATVSHADSFCCDEPSDRLGLKVMLAPQLKVSKRRDAYATQLPQGLILQTARIYVALCRVDPKLPALARVDGAPRF